MFEYTDEEIKEALEKIATMDRETMARLWRFGPDGSAIYFRNDLPTGPAFKKRFFDELGGFSPEISKKIGLTPP